MRSMTITRNMIVESGGAARQFVKGDTFGVVARVEDDLREIDEGTARRLMRAGAGSLPGAAEPETETETDPDAGPKLDDMKVADLVAYIDAKGLDVDKTISPKAKLVEAIKAAEAKPVE